jgi:prepilin-type N-terminal cleavage/methylation domain-containing protein
MITSIHNREDGFSLLEILIVFIIIGIGAGWALPNYHKVIAQKHVDSYTRRVESGLFNLKAYAGKKKVSCSIIIDKDTSFTGSSNAASFRQPWKSIEFYRDGSRSSNPGSVQCMSSNGSSSPFRLIEQEQSPETNHVVVSIDTGINLNNSCKSTLNNQLCDPYVISPPGTSTQSASFTVLIKHPEVIINTRCIKMLGNGFILNGRWTASNTCEA